MPGSYSVEDLKQGLEAFKSGTSSFIKRDIHSPIWNNGEREGSTYTYYVHFTDSRFSDPFHPKDILTKSTDTPVLLHSGQAITIPPHGLSEGTFTLSGEAGNHHIIVSGTIKDDKLVDANGIDICAAIEKLAHNIQRAHLLKIIDEGQQAAEVLEVASIRQDSRQSLTADTLPTSIQISDRTQALQRLIADSRTAITLCAAAPSAT